MSVRFRGPDPKPQKRILDPRAGIDKLVAEGRCRLCGRVPYAGHPLDSLTRHHIVGRDAGGDDVEDNLVPLCGSGTTGCHFLIEDARRASRSKLRATFTERELAYVIRKKSTAWLDRHYPKEP